MYYAGCCRFCTFLANENGGSCTSRYFAAAAASSAVHTVSAAGRAAVLRAARCRCRRCTCNLLRLCFLITLFPLVLIKALLYEEAASHFAILLLPENYAQLFHYAYSDSIR